MAQRGTTAKIELQELEKLCALQCTDEEIAAWFRVSTRTVERRRKVKTFSEVMEHGKARGRISIRRAQMRLLEEGNATMGVWLGKQYLGQTEQFPQEAQGARLIVIMPSPPCAQPQERPAIDVAPTDAVQPAAMDRVPRLGPGTPQAR